MRRNTQESIESKAQRSGECLLWTGFCEKTGYGRVWYQNKAHWVHRLVYEWHHGPIPAGETVDHLCNTRNCIEPSHLDVCSRGENPSEQDSVEMCAEMGILLLSTDVERLTETHTVSCATGSLNVNKTQSARINGLGG